MKRFLLATTVLLSLNAAAQSWDPELSINADARIDYQNGWIDGKQDDSQSGFKGQYLDIQFDGQFNKYLKYSWRQRLNKSAYNSHFFDATDWVYLTFSPNDKWDFTAGKQVIDIGGFEYDSSPIDIYRYSEYCNHIPCYGLGVAAGYTLPGGNDKLIAQVTNNPFFDYPQVNNTNTYSYNLMWKGNHGIYKSLWTLNMVEYRKGHYISYIALGNRIEWNRWRFDLDLMNRAAAHQTFFFKDFSMMADVRYSFPKVTVYGKATYDVNHSGRDADYCVYDGTELWQFMLGAEYHPFNIPKHDIRLHANISYSKGTNTNPDPVILDKNLILNVGLTWKFDICHLKKKTQD